MEICFFSNISVLNVVDFSLSLLTNEQQKRPSCNFISQAKKSHRHQQKLQHLQLILVAATSTSKCMHEFIVKRSVRSEAVYNLTHRYSLVSERTVKMQ